MKFSVQLPTDRVEQLEEFTHADAIAEMAVAMEIAGFDACYVTEHPFPADDWLEASGHHALDPFVSLSAAAMVTRQLRLHTNLIVLPYRNPFLTAKSIASLDTLSGGRVIMGVGAGYLQGEYAALGADFANRNDRTDDAIAAMQAAWTGKSVRRDGEHYDAIGNTALPRPVQRPHPPIWVGGNSRIAIRRAATSAEGWSPFPLPAAHAGTVHTSAIESHAELAEKIDYLHRYSAEIGRDTRVEINFVPFGHGMNSSQAFDYPAFREEVAELEALGVDWLSIGVPGNDRASYIESIQQFGAEVIV
jgi:probable F420-dependent oxidoreductase